MVFKKEDEKYRNSDFFIYENIVNVAYEEASCIRSNLLGSHNNII